MREGKLNGRIGCATVMNNPRGQIVNRSALLQEVETDVAALLSLGVDMDDLILQFDTTDLGHRFAEAWKRARIMVDGGSGQGNTRRFHRLRILRRCIRSAA